MSLLMFPNRKNIRLKGYDYSADGYYYITICTKEKKHLFGRIVDKKLFLNDIGKMVEAEIKKIPDYFEFAQLDEYVVMPNHLHFIIILDKSNLVDTSLLIPQKNLNFSKFANPNSKSVSFIIQQLKASVKRWCNKNNHEQFQWQNRFFDRIVRNEEELCTYREYIKDNVINWDKSNLEGSN